MVLHAERLEHDAVWAATRRFLRRLTAVGARATLFVHPFSAIERGIDLAPRLRELVEGGHEIGQHTHFYASRAPDPETKPVSDLDPSNVRRCLARDLEYLVATGMRPAGFTAGGWASLPEVAEWLGERGFLYDSTERSFELRYASPPAVAGGGATGARMRGAVVSLPTTASVRDGLVSAVFRTRRSLDAPGFRYDLAYLHDYDLLSPRRRDAASALVFAWRSGSWRSACELARYVRDGGP
jgi:hypothetical protein